MERRKFLFTVGTCTALAGCTGNEESESTSASTPKSTPTPTEEPTPTSEPEPTEQGTETETVQPHTPDPNPTTEPGNLTIGETYQTPEGVILSILDLRTVETDNPDNQAALAYAYAENQSGSSTIVPFHQEWVMLADNQQYQPQSTPNEEDTYEGGEILDGVVRGGWILYGVPANLDLNDLIVAWSGEFIDENAGETQEVTITWSR